MATTEILEGKNVLLIKGTRIVREYKSETEGFKGKKYRVYAFGEKAFTVHEDEEQDFLKGLKASGEDQIAEVQFVVTNEGWSMSNYLTWAQVNALKANQKKNESITVEMFKPESVKAYEGIVS